MSSPIFFDPTGRRGTIARGALAAFIVLIVAAAIAFATTLVATPGAAGLPLPFGQRHAAQMHAAGGRGRSWLPHFHAKGAAAPLTVGFYVPGDDAGVASLRAHVATLDWVVPALVSVTGADHHLTLNSDRQFDAIVAAAPNAPKVLPMVQNFGTSWDGKGAATLIADPAARHALATHLASFVADRHAHGLVMDFENLPAGTVPGYLRLLSEIRAALPKGSELAVTAPAADAQWNLAALGHAADRVILMAYDQHWEGGEAGPIAAQHWFIRAVEDGVRQLGRDKLIVALGSYAYDWHKSGADALSIEEAWLAAHDSEAPVHFDAASGNAGFAYDDAGDHHEIWMLDAAASWNELVALKQLGIVDVAMWRLGSEDPGLWSDFAAFRNGGRPELGQLQSALNVDVEGSGELLRVTASPTVGHRTTGFDRAGMIRGERYDALPTPYVVQRAGASPHAIALTFDDGPDPTWTPRILDVLEKAHVPATFFVIGENALQQPGLLRRIVADGDEIGNHSYTHPNLALDGADATRLELNATQRLIEAYTGRATRLFRAPYFGDAEPTTQDEIGPALIAQQAGYTVVGLHVDPNDWQRPGTDAIVSQVLDQVHRASPGNAENVVLLHDGGGDRAQTVAALPRIISALRAEGYNFVPVSQLVGLSQGQVMPKIDGADLLAVRTDVVIFVALAILAGLLGWLFYLAIALGIARAVLMAGLAWFQARRGRPTPPEYVPSVSVIIPAYNEAKVIESSVRRVLASDYPGLSVIVADDGSKDATSAIVAAAFADDPRVTLLTLPNGGKAAALNRALLQAEGEIIIALDADTQFEPATIRRLARWFADPAIGAVAGDARVGNTVNLVTRWQAIEYITAQNLERRALAGFDAMTVVPGAVGAWRRVALDVVGGYPEDTLAEDQDLTIAIQRAGWRVTFDPEAVAWTEAPESFKALAKQRYRWAFGTLQCLWKHRAVLWTRRPAGLALVGLPQAWLFQIAFAAISPLIDLTLILSLVGTVLRVVQHGWAQTSGDVGQMGLYWLAFVTIDVLCGWLAYRLDGKRARYPAALLVAQRFVYRQIMYWVVVRAIASAIGGWVVGWGKLERSGSVAAPQPA
ncbi:glycosyltransferase [Sphingomonas sp. MMS12-HWE2-04]|uniref:glycosyltransferase n=1 Tax=Sphingomonas sp. MMS12-HWE2-04 TaxID=3234199 RepID=UPI0038507DA0